MGAIAVETTGRVCRIRLNRPDKLNALNLTLRDELRRQLEVLAEEPDVSVLVLSGEGRAFSAGADLARGSLDPTPSAPPSWAQRRHDMGAWQRLLDLLEAVPQVTVASIHGHCIGGAALLAVSCDIRIGADDISVRIPELAIGIPLTWAGNPRLAREIGLPMARELVMTGRVLDGEAALRCGFVQRLVPLAELDAATDALVEELLAMPPGPLAMTRAAFSALSRERLGAGAWADPDLLGWSFTERESRDAAATYTDRRRGDKPR